METDLSKARITLNEAKVLMRPWVLKNFSKNKDGSSRTWREPLMGIVEEVGELHHHLLKQVQGIRGSYEEHEEQAKDSIGDILIYLVDLCSERNWDPEEILGGTVRHVLGRDWIEDSKNGVTATPAVQDDYSHQYDTTGPHS